jgi:hypothetical protein
MAKASDQAKEFSYTFVDGDVLTDIENLRTLRAAGDERLAVSELGSEEVSSRLPRIGEYALWTSRWGRSFAGGWWVLQQNVWQVGIFGFVQSYAADGTTPLTDPKDYCQWSSFGSNFGPSITFVRHGGPLLTRRWPLEIQSLSADGVDGQVARFSASDNTSLTPLAERVNSGRLFRRTQVVVSPPGVLPEAKEPRWVEAPDAADPDVVTYVATDTGSGDGLAHAGDYAGTWIPNEIRDEEKKLRWTFLPADWANRGNGEVVFNYSESQSAGLNGLERSCTAGDYEALFATMVANAAERFGSGTEFGEGLLGNIGACGSLDVIESWETRAWTYEQDGGFNPGASSQSTNYVLGAIFADYPYIVWLDRVLQSRHGYPYVLGLPLRRRKKKIEWVVGGYKFATDTDDARFVYDTFGFSIPYRQPAHWAEDVYEGIDALGPKVGDAAHAPTAAAGSRTEIGRGFSVVAGAVIKWDTDGGFEYF